MRTVIHRGEARGFTEKGWVHSLHTFSFGDYDDPVRSGFGAVQAINETTLMPGEGSDMHHHKNMEIVTIPLEGTLEYRDSMGNAALIGPGDILVMSAGTGMYDSGYNHSGQQPAKFLQVWILPCCEWLQPSYGKLSFEECGKDSIRTVVSPGEIPDTARIHQQAWLSLAHVSKGNIFGYTFHREGHCVYIFILDGAVKVDGEHLYNRDGMGISGTGSFLVEAITDTRFLIIEVPAGVER